MTVRQNTLGAIQGIVKILGIVLGLALVSQLYTTNTYAMEDADYPESNLEEISSGTLVLHSAHNVGYAPMLSSALQIDISGMIAKVELTQSFQNDTANWVEARYSFPLPDQSAVNSLIINVGDRTIVGEIKEKKQAEAQFQSAKQEGRVATLVKQHRPNLFFASVANIAPGETISVKLIYIQHAAYHDDLYSLRIPLTLTPRYFNDTVNAPDELTVPQISLPSGSPLETLSHRVSINGTVHGTHSHQTFSSPSHRLNLSNIDEATQFELSDVTYLDRDFLLEWSDSKEMQPIVRVWRETVDAEDYLLASILPPGAEDNLPEQPRELIVVIDTSGSMAGDSMPAAISALVNALSGLRANDKFNIIEFDDTHRALFETPQFANTENLAAGRLFAQRLYADGGTEMLPALQTAMNYPHTEMLRQIVFITDGSVNYEESVIESVARQLRGARLFTVGIGAAPNQWFMRKVAQAGRGTAVHISKVQDVGKVMSRLLDKLEKPVLTNIAVQIDDPSSDVVPNPIPDLYANEPVVVAARLGSKATSLTVTGRWGNQPWEQRVDFKDSPFVNTGLSSVWARRKIEHFEDKQRSHSDPEYYKSIILRLALNHQLLSRYTSFVAIEEEISRPQAADLKLGAVPNLKPAVTPVQSVTLPQGSAGSDTLLLLGLLMALLALVLHTRSVKAQSARANGRRVA